MSKDLIRYDLLVQEALKGVLRKLLADTARDGLPGEHHFYITFKTAAPGVRLSQRMRDKYPDEMTIVLQHQFWDLGVTEHAFEVGLSFGGVPERLLVPFDSISGFFDPSVQFGLKFEQHEPATEQDDAAPQGQPALRSVPRAVEDVQDEPPAARPSPAKAPRARQPKSGDDAAQQAGQEPAKLSDKSEPTKEPKAKPAGKPADAPGETGAQVVSLDAFRKKT